MTEGMLCHRILGIYAPVKMSRIMAFALACEQGMGQVATNLRMQGCTSTKHFLLKRLSCLVLAAFMEEFECPSASQCQTVETLLFWGRSEQWQALGGGGHV